jgi:hypothetical protein
MTSRPTNRVFRALVGVLLALCLQTIAFGAPAVRVTLQLDKTILKVGEITTAHVFAEIVADQKTNTEQIVTWYVDLLNTSPAAIDIVANSVVVPFADSSPNTSSKGALTGGNLRAVYDTFLNTPDAGHDGPIELFSVQLKAIAVGNATFSVAAGTTAPALDEDFIVSTTSGDPAFGGLYDTATADVTSFNNVPPTINTITNRTIIEGDRLTVTAVGRDADVGQTLRYTFATAAPAGATLDPVTGVMSWTPAENQAPIVFTFRIKVSDNGTPAMSATNEFVVTVNELNTAPTVQAPAAITRGELQAITATFTAADVDILQGRTPNTNRLTFSLIDAPAGATINPSTGVFSWTPTEAQGPGSYTIKVQVVDDGVPALAGNAQFTVTITEQNAAPTITAPASQTIAEGASLNVAFVANDVDLPANQLTFGLVNAPPGVVLDSGTGLISWTPTEAQGPGVYSIQVRVSDNAPVPLFATNTMQVTVTEVNAAPTLAVLVDRTVTETTPLSFTAVATDTDLPGQTLTFALDTPPAGASINPTTGAFTWTPTEAQGPGRYTIVVRVTDNGTPARSDTKSFDVTVNEQNADPVLTTPAGQGTQTIPELVAKTIQFTATDPDVPANLITFALQNAPSGASIDAATGLFTWTPTEAQGPGVYNNIRVVATDNGTPARSTTNVINLTVSEASSAPVVSPIENQTVAELTKLTLPIVATDTDLPAQTLTFSLTAAPPGAAIDSTTGVLTWTPTEAQGPGQFNITVRVTESGTAALFATRTFSMAVTEANVAPTFVPPATVNATEMTPLTARFIATDPDIVTGQTPSTNRLTYALLDAPAGMTIDSQTGALTWTPTEAQGPATYQVRASVTDDGIPELSSTATMTINVLEANRTPAMSVPVPQTVAELTTLRTNYFVSDADLPANKLSFVLISAPPGVQLNPTNGAVTWTPTEAQGPGTYSITAAVIDDGSPARSATNTISVSVTEVNTKPVFSGIPDFTLAVGSTINFIASATDSDIPAQTLVYSMDSGPAGASINSATGNFVWTPTLAQGGQQFTIVLRAAESGPGGLFDTRTFKITVTGASPANTAPIILNPPNQTVVAGSTLTVTNIATDADLPANTLTFALVSAPTGATIDAATGVLTWTPTSAQVGDTQIRVKVTDNGVPPLSNTNTFQVTVTEGSSGLPATLRIISVLAGGVTLRVEGEANASYDIEFSPDLFNWSPLTTVSLGAQTFNTYLDAAHGFGQQLGFYRAKSRGGSAQPSAPTITPQSIGPGGLTLRVAGSAGATYRVQFSTDLISWTQIGSVSLTTGTSADYIDTAQSTRGDKGFYRAIFP